MEVISPELEREPIQEREVHAAQLGDVAYRMYITARFFHTAGLAKVTEELFRNTGPGQAKIEVNDFANTVKSTFTVNIDKRYVYSLKRVAFAAYLSLYDLGEEGVQIGRDVLYSLKGEKREKVNLVDRLDE